ncbi:MAG TPA: division/cell wall cluster transcriptional repressor MraZ [Candidatus Saccharimonadia bacterium]|nr:division/cell wall cluster transcriptional repressor MraZ [Candidatus Saccharimonadia bacterium]
MYIGRYYHTIEEQGRVAVPVSFRQQLGKTPVVTRGLDGCLFLFAQEEWQVFIGNIEGAPFTKKTNRDLTRLMANEAAELELDAQGRVLIPEFLKTYAKLNKQVVFAGSINKVEVWDQEQYHAYLESVEGRAEEIAEQFDLPQKGMNA